MKPESHLKYVVILPSTKQTHQNKSLKSWQKWHSWYYIIKQHTLEITHFHSYKCKPWLWLLNNALSDLASSLIFLAQNENLFNTEVHFRWESRSLLLIEKKSWSYWVLNPKPSNCPDCQLVCFIASKCHPTYPLSNSKGQVKPWHLHIFLISQ